MRLASLLIVLFLSSHPSFSQPDAVDTLHAAGGGMQASDSRAQASLNEARWADLEAQRRATDGDYDGAVQAHEQAEQNRLAVERSQTAAQTSK